MKNIIIIGAAGRMGRRLVTLTTEATDLNLVGAIEYSESPFLGQDAGLVAGVGNVDVPIVASLDEVIEKGDAIIDFSTGTVVENAKKAVAANCSVVIGTTALNDDDVNTLKELGQNGGHIVFAPNFSVGVNLLLKLTKMATEVLDDYDIEILEMHHNQKKDAPSGTAARLAEVITDVKELSYKDDVVHGREGIVGARTANEIGMHAIRGGDVVGDHTVIYATGGERIELTHKASSRDTFAKGALRAVRFLATAEAGLYDMQDVLGLN